MYAELLLRIVREAVVLKGLDESMGKTRHTQTREMMLEFKKYPMIKSSTLRKLVTKPLRTLSQEVVVKIKKLNEITTEEELWSMPATALLRS